MTMKQPLDISPAIASVQQEQGPSPGGTSPMKLQTSQEPTPLTHTPGQPGSYPRERNRHGKRESDE